MIAALLAILACQLIGEVVTYSLHLPIPGPVLGMLLMVVGFAVSPRLLALVRPIARAILDNLLILFVPAGVGAAVQLGKLGDQTLPVVLAVVISTILAIVVGAAVFAGVARLTGNIDDEPDFVPVTKDPMREDRP